jgi:hypothetical protein
MSDTRGVVTDASSRLGWLIIQAELSVGEAIRRGARALAADTVTERRQHLPTLTDRFAQAPASQYRC